MAQIEQQTCAMAIAGPRERRVADATRAAAVPRRAVAVRGGRAADATGRVGADHGRPVAALGAVDGLADQLRRAGRVPTARGLRGVRKRRSGVRALARGRRTAGLVRFSKKIGSNWTTQC